MSHIYIKHQITRNIWTYQDTNTYGTIAPYHYVIEKE